MGCFIATLLAMAEKAGSAEHQFGIATVFSRRDAKAQGHCYETNFNFRTLELSNFRTFSVFPLFRHSLIPRFLFRWQTVSATVHKPQRSQPMNDDQHGQQATCTAAHKSVTKEKENLKML